MSDLVVVAQVIDINESAGNDKDGPLTEANLKITHLIKGKTDEMISISYRGGNANDGSVQAWSTVPKLANGDTYLLFLRNDYYLTPIIPEKFGILRIEKYKSKSIVVDRDGNLVKVSKRFGFITSRPFSYSLENKWASSKIVKSEEKPNIGIGEKLILLNREKNISTSDFSTLKKVLLAIDYFNKESEYKYFSSLKPRPKKNKVQIKALANKINNKKVKDKIRENKYLTETDAHENDIIVIKEDGNDDI